jgi:hypothetical protein
VFCSNFYITTRCATNCRAGLHSVGFRHFRRTLNRTGSDPVECDPAPKWGNQHCAQPRPKGLQSFEIMRNRARRAGGTRSLPVLHPRPRPGPSEWIGGATIIRIGAVQMAVRTADGVACRSSRHAGGLGPRPPPRQPEVRAGSEVDGRRHLRRVRQRGYRP